MKGEVERKQGIHGNHTAALRDLERQHREMGGDQIEQWEAEKQGLEIQRTERLRKRGQAEDACRKLGWILPASPHGFAELTGNARQEVENWEGRSNETREAQFRLWEWQYPEMDGAYPRPADIAIRQEKDGRGDGYICDLNDIQVFSGPVVPGESLLISRESFLRVFFKEYRKGVFVNAETSEVPESKTLVDLKLSFERAVEVAFPTIVRIRYEVPASRDSSQTEN